MKKYIVMAAALAAAASLHAQSNAEYQSVLLPGIIGERTGAFQYFVNSGAQTVTFDGVSNKPVTGRPFSATEVRHTLQTLADGTRIEKTESSKYFRDGEGRTRTENADGSTVSVSDPVSGASAEMSGGQAQNRKIVRRGTFRTTSTAAAMGSDMSETKKLALEQSLQMAREKVIAEMASQAKANADSGTTPKALPTAVFAVSRDKLEAKNKGTSEDLGVQLINGIAAKGTRTTITIPVGQIGNDREIKVVSERWFSDDLGMLIKSTNNDPRFGETTYELTNVLQVAQDPSLFQIPEDVHGK